MLLLSYAFNQYFLSHAGVLMMGRNQIVDHVSPLVDPAAIAARKREEARQQAAGAFKHVPSWNTGSFHLFGGVKVSAMHKRIMKDNAALLAQQVAPAP